MPSSCALRSRSEPASRNRAQTLETFCGRRRHLRAQEAPERQPNIVPGPRRLIRSGPIRLPREQDDGRIARQFAAEIRAAEGLRPWGRATVSAGKGIFDAKHQSYVAAPVRSPAMKQSVVSTVVLVAAIACLHSPTRSAAQSAAPAAAPDTLLTASTAPRYPIARTTFTEAIARYGIGSGHRAMYANITGDRMWSIANRNSASRMRNRQSTRRSDCAKTMR
jgi:hypothetical protein